MCALALNKTDLQSGCYLNIRLCKVLNLNFHVLNVQCLKTRPLKFSGLGGALRLQSACLSLAQERKGKKKEKRGGHMG